MAIIPHPLKVFVAGAVASACLAMAGPVSATMYSLTEIGASLDAGAAEARGLNNSGDAVGVTLGFRQSQGFIDAGGVASPIRIDNFTQTLAINDAGVVTGWSSASSGSARQAFSWSNGTTTLLGTLGGGRSEAAAINSSGQITGAASLADEQYHAFRYTSGTMSDLGTLGGTYSQGFGINDAGQVTGVSSLQGDAVNHAFLTGAKGLTDLGTLGGAESRGNDVNAAGLVTGTASLADGSSHAFLYGGGTMKDLGTLASSFDSIGYGINDHGDVTGAAIDSFGVLSGAFLYSKGSLLDLNSLLDPVSGKGWTLLEGRDINDLGQIVGTGVDAFGRQAAFLLTPLTVTPVPEPSTYALMLLGLAGIGWSARRRHQPTAFAKAAGAG